MSGTEPNEGGETDLHRKNYQIRASVAPDAYQAFTRLHAELEGRGVKCLNWGGAAAKITHDALLSVILLDFLDRHTGPERLEVVRRLLPRHGAAVTGRPPPANASAGGAGGPVADTGYTPGNPAPAPAPRRQRGGA